MKAYGVREERDLDPVMTLLKVRERAEITLPREIRDALNVQEGDYLEAEVVEGGVLLRPATSVDKATARARLKETLSGSRWIGPGPEPSEDEVMQEAVRLVKEARKEMATERHAGRSR
jgi:AbrB family looped-hinge helix DNA binding protein